MFGDKTLISHLAATFKIMVQVVELDGDGNSVARLSDSTHVVKIRFAFVVSKKANGINNLSVDRHEP